jgi:hypothetical protein
VGSWFSGDWYDAAARNYIRQVQARLAAREWEGLAFAFQARGATDDGRALATSDAHGAGPQGYANGEGAADPEARESPS